jgi:VWFA-related protein
MMKQSCIACLLFAAAAAAQTPEVTTKEAPVTFKSTSNLVSVPVVVRDNKGRAVGNLGIDDFQLFDNGKLQIISRFVLEKTEEPVDAIAPSVKTTANQPANADTPVASATLRDRFVAYLFDDLHMSFSELVYPRDAAKRQIDSSEHIHDRVAIYTTSGQHMQDFTSDRDKLHTALATIGVGTAVAAKAMQQNSCPPLTYYEAEQIENNVMAAWVTAMDELMACGPAAGGSTKGLARSAQTAVETTVLAPGCLVKGLYPLPCPAVELSKPGIEQTRVRQAAQLAILAGDRDTEWSLDALRTVVNKMAAMPGKRSIVLISPGFLVQSERLEEETSLIERAIKANVVIGALDARGLYTQIPGGDASDRGTIYGASTKAGLQAQEALGQSSVLDTLAAGTGGTFYKGANDFDEGLARTAAAPEFLYVLAFTPDDLKLDGSYHNLKVTLKNVKGMNLQVRKGYYAAKYSADPKEQIKQQIEEAFFSREEIHDLPVTLAMQYFKLDNGDVKLSSVGNIDIKNLTFHKAGDRNLNDITVETGIFDADGNFVTGFEKVVTLKLLDGTLEERRQSGIPVKSTFTVHPGRYMLRMVVRDTGDQLMAAQSKVVELP